MSLPIEEQPIQAIPSQSQPPPIPSRSPRHGLSGGSSNSLLSIQSSRGGMRKAIADRLSFLKIESQTSSSSAASVSSPYPDSIGSRNTRYSWSDNTSISSVGSIYSAAKSVPEIGSLWSPTHDYKHGLWNGILRVIPCGEDHSHLMWSESFETCTVCGFSQWHALMVHARSINTNSFGSAMRSLKNFKKKDLAGNSPFHYLLSTGPSIHHIAQLFQLDRCMDPHILQNVFGQNPLHLLNPHDLGEQFFNFIEWLKSETIPMELLLAQRDIYCHTPLHNFFQRPLEEGFYRRILQAIPKSNHQLHCLDRSGQNILELMGKTALKLKSSSAVDSAKIEAGITEIRIFLSDAERIYTRPRYGFHDIARGARGTSYFVFYECHICGQTNAHPNTYLEQIKCACRLGRDRGDPDETGMTPAHALLAFNRCNDDEEWTPETPSQTAELFRVLIPSKEPQYRDSLHVLDPEGNSLLFKIAVKSLDKTLEHVLLLEEPWKRQFMVNTYGKSPDGTRRSVLDAVLHEVERTTTRIKAADLSVNNLLKEHLIKRLRRLKRVRETLVVVGAKISPDDFGLSNEEPGMEIETSDKPHRRSSKEEQSVTNIQHFLGVKSMKAVEPSSRRKLSKSQIADNSSDMTGAKSKVHPALIKGNNWTADTNKSLITRTFPIDATLDVDLIYTWRKAALPGVRQILCSKSDASVSITLLRQGTNESQSQPIIRIQTSTPRSPYEQASIKRFIHVALQPLPTPLIIFKTGTVRRTAHRSDLDIPPCAAHNTSFLPRPGMGMSIGIGGSLKDTATLGGYIYIDGIPHILTVHHLFVDEEINMAYQPGTCITQPSLQELSEHTSLLDTTDSTLHSSCLQSMSTQLHTTLPSFSFGHLATSSGFRNRRSRNNKSANVEMDWAVCRVNTNRVGSNTTPCKRNWCRGASEVILGGNVFSVGRTSGLQSGVVNGDTTSLSLLNQENWNEYEEGKGKGKARDEEERYRCSEEYTILRPESTTEKEWIKSGIGVCGDSGAWILESGTDNVVGQLWGRDFVSSSPASFPSSYSSQLSYDGRMEEEEEGQIITYFTPIHDIFDDIRERTGAENISVSVEREYRQTDEHIGPKDILPLGSLRFLGKENEGAVFRVCGEDVDEKEAPHEGPGSGNKIEGLFGMMERSAGEGRGGCWEPELHPDFCFCFEEIDEFEVVLGTGVGVGMGSVAIS